MEEGNLAILVDAKSEYTKQLINILKINIYNGIKIIFQTTKKYCIENDNSENILQHFQEALSEIPKWNQEVIDNECLKIIDNSKCDWLEDLITAVFVSHTRILTSINFSKNKKKINLKIPKVESFIHKCYIDVARSFWKTPYLFDDSISKYDFQRNRRDVESIIEDCIEETIRKQLPVKHILKEYLGTDYQDDTAEDELIEEDLPNKYKENLRKMVKTEIENLSNEKMKLNIESEQILTKTTDTTAPANSSSTNNTTATDATNTTDTDATNTTDTDANTDVIGGTSANDANTDVIGGTSANDANTDVIGGTSANDATDANNNDVVETFTANDATIDNDVVDYTDVVETVAATDTTSNLANNTPVNNTPVNNTPNNDVIKTVATAANAANSTTTNLNNNVVETVAATNSVDNVVENISNISPEKDLNIDSLEELNLDSIVEDSGLNIENLDLDLDLDLENIEEPTTSSYSEPQNNVKTIIIDTNKEEENKGTLLKKYAKKKDYSFFEDGK